MNKLEKNERFSSCRGVSFEIKDQRRSSCPITVHAQDDFIDNRVWLPRNQNSLKVFPGSSVIIERSLSRPSSHFCDLDLDCQDGNNEECMEEMHDVEKQKPIVLPTKASRNSESRLSIILLDQGLFTVYKQLFVVCFALNLFALILASTGHFAYAKNRATLFSIGNIFTLTLCRSEAVLRVVFWLAVKAFGRPWVPLKIKTAVTAFLQCLGGIHSGCGVASIMWLVYSLVLALKDKENTSHEIIGVAFAILFLVCLSSLAAFPLVRHLHHNVFERTHRFSGWSALFLLWVFILLTITYDPSSKSYRSLICTNLIKHQEFWFTLAINLLIILPWLTVRRVAVTVSAPSGHASIIKFDGGVRAGLLGRISPSPLSEWHAFGIISDGKKDHMMLAGAVGDFTRTLVSNPPSHLWVRQVHFSGLPYLVNMYESVLLVATGSGICVFLSFLLQPCSTDVHLIWVAKGIEQNFGHEIMNMVCGYSKDKVIVHDTAVLGRPNVSNMTVDAAKRWKAEVVIVTSNPEGSRDVVDACKGAKIPAFGPIWDS
ncbi:Adenylate-forming reductase [Thalictrum thalictroides]|uniref:Adenylate-forming reductase n=1 Tax=Thalictrum thalictroides TaxID=46969 RepID=A0A7J6VMC9_THATH|nr:Adenylate-forming reductase [Thalictrum thalictroides]